MITRRAAWLESEAQKCFERLVNRYNQPTDSLMRAVAQGPARRVQSAPYSFNGPNLLAIGCGAIGACQIKVSPAPGLLARTPCREELISFSHFALR